MNDILANRITFWVTVAAGAAAIAVLTKQQFWIAAAIVGTLAIVIAAASALQSWRKSRANVKPIIIDGISIDALTIANLYRTRNRSLFIETANHRAKVEGRDLEQWLEYIGTCEAASESGLVFSVDGDARTKLADIDCYGYDLKADPERQHKRVPQESGGYGISKKVKLLFAAPVHKREAFHVELHSTIHGCMAWGGDAFFSTLSFKQDTVKKWTITIDFVGVKPLYVRTYGVAPSGEVEDQGDLTPISETSTSARYIREMNYQPSHSACVFVFDRLAP